MRKLIIISIFIGVGLAFKACQEDLPMPEPDEEWVYDPQPYDLELPKTPPIVYSDMPQPADNIMTDQGVELGRHLFYDERISEQGQTSCATCHQQEFSFGDNVVFSEQDGGTLTTRNTPPLVNLGWAPHFFWDGRELTLEDAVLDAITNEQHVPWEATFTWMESDTLYQRLFFEAFGITEIEEDHIVKAIAQFVRSLISKDSRYEWVWLFGGGTAGFTDSELRGLLLSEDLLGADCVHCHGTAFYPFLTDFRFANNGLDSVFTDLGREDVTNDIDDRAAFKVPQLRNLSVTGPYMHDGRFTELSEVIDHYSEGIVNTIYTDPLIEYAAQGGVQLTPQEKIDLEAFFLMFDDTVFLNNPKFSDPFEE